MPLTHINQLSQPQPISDKPDITCTLEKKYHPSHETTTENHFVLGEFHRKLKTTRAEYLHHWKPKWTRSILWRRRAGQTARLNWQERWMREQKCTQTHFINQCGRWRRIWFVCSHGRSLLNSAEFRWLVTAPGFYIWSLAAIVGSGLVAQRVTGLNQRLSTHLPRPIALTRPQTKEPTTCHPCPNWDPTPPPPDPDHQGARIGASWCWGRARGGAEGAAVVTRKEVLRQAVNWVRIMSVVSRPNASEEQTQGCCKGGDSLVQPRPEETRQDYGDFMNPERQIKCRTAAKAAGILKLLNLLKSPQQKCSMVWRVSDASQSQQYNSHTHLMQRQASSVEVRESAAFKLLVFTILSYFCHLSKKEHYDRPPERRSLRQSLIYT